MAKRGEYICVVCGKKHEYCPNCGKGRYEDGWKTMYCSSECRQIFKICSAYAFHHLSADEARKKLIELNATDATKYSEDIRKTITAIMAESAANKAETNNKVASASENKTEVVADKDKIINNNNKDFKSSNKDHNNNHNPNAFKKNSAFVNNGKN